MKKSHTEIWRIAAYYFFYYSAGSIYIYLPKYLQQGARFTVEQNGIVQAVGPLVAIITPFIWGQVADKSKSRNTVWLVMIGLTALCVLCIPLTADFAYIAVLLTLVSVFQTSITPLGDSVCTELCTLGGWDFGRVRRMAPLGYAVCTLAAGTFLRMDHADIFIAYAAVLMFSLLPASRLDKVPGYQSTGKRLRFYKLFANKPLVILYGFIFCIFLTSSYYYSFFLLYFTSPEVGGTTALYGICNALASVSEFPFLLFAGKLIKKIGMKRVFLCGLGMLGLRWLLLGIVAQPYALMAINMLHGVSFACVLYCSVLYVNQYVQVEFRASGQAFSALISYGITKVIASAAGGFLTGLLGYQIMFVAMGIFIFLVAGAYAMVIPYLERHNA